VDKEIHKILKNLLEAFLRRFWHWLLMSLLARLPFLARFLVKR